MSPKCDLTVTDADLTVKNTLAARSDRQSLLKSFIFSRQSCSFIPSRIAPTHGSVVLLVFAVEDDIHVDVVALGEDDAIVRLGECQLPLDKSSMPDTISNISCSDTGHLSVLGTCINGCILHIYD